MGREADPRQAARPGRGRPQRAASIKWHSIRPAPLPPVGYLDQANNGAFKDATFTLVGYGVDIGDKKQQIVVQERRFTTSFLKNIQDEVVVFQINSNDSKAGGWFVIR